MPIKGIVVTPRNNQEEKRKPKKKACETLCLCVIWKKNRETTKTSGGNEQSDQNCPLVLGVFPILGLWICFYIFFHFFFQVSNVSVEAEARLVRR